MPPGPYVHNKDNLPSFELTINDFPEQNTKFLQGNILLERHDIFICFHHEATVRDRFDSINTLP